MGRGTRRLGRSLAVSVLTGALAFGGIGLSVASAAPGEDPIAPGGGSGTTTTGPTTTSSSTTTTTTKPSGGGGTGGGSSATTSTTDPNAEAACTARTKKKLTAKRRPKRSKRAKVKIKVKVKVRAGEDLIAKTSGKVSGRSAKGTFGSRSTQINAGRTKTIKFLKKATSRKKGTAKAKFTVRCTNTAGRTKITKLKVKIRVR